MSKSRSAFAIFSTLFALFFTLTLAYSVTDTSIVGAKVVHYGWPMTWLRATTLTVPQSPTRYSILWPGFAFDIILYSAISLLAATLSVYTMASPAVTLPKLRLEQRPQAGDLEALKQRLQRLEAENKALSRDLRRSKRKPSRLWGITLLALGGLSLAAATAYSSLIPAFIGLGLTFWGALLLYIRPVRYIRKELLDSTAPNTLAALRQLVDEMGYRGKGIYMPPRTLREHGTSTLIMPRSTEPTVPAVEKVVEPAAPFGNPAGLVLTPPGLGLARLIQKELGRDLSTADLGYLASNLPKVMIEDLEMADDVEIEPGEDSVSVKLKGPLLTVRSGEKAELEELDYLPSAIACILTWTTGKPITVENLTISKDGQLTEARFRILEA